MSRVYKKDTFYLCSCIFILSVIIKIFQFSLLPDKYFYDSRHIMGLMNGNYIADKAYNYTAKFFDTINIFHFSTLLEWAIFLSIIFTTIIFFFLIKHPIPFIPKNLCAEKLIKSTSLKSNLVFPII